MPEPKRPNHILHLLLTLFTCFWAIVWIALAVNYSSALRQHAFKPWLDKADRVHVNEDGAAFAAAPLSAGLGRSSPRSLPTRSGR
jgi:hypothetical protein